MRIRLPGAGDRRWSEVVKEANEKEAAEGRTSSGLPPDGGNKRLMQIGVLPPACPQGSVH
eukprot:SAG11_NODE_14153_length_623_cov_0.799618_1_plen_60_part_00